MSLESSLLKFLVVFTPVFIIVIRLHPLLETNSYKLA
jgi:hypothetical protein